MLPYGLRSELGRIKRYVKYAYHLNLARRGEFKKCPICNKDLAMFLPYGKKSIHCPNCSSFPRHRALWLYMSKHALLKENISILHISPEPAFFESFKNKNNYVAIDKFSNGYSYPKSVLRMDIEHLDFDDNTFELIICSHVLEHVDNDYKALREMARVTKQDGSVLVMVPIETKFDRTYENKNIVKPTERRKHFGQQDHLRLYGMDFPARTVECGFDCQVYTTEALFSSSEFSRYGLEFDFIFHLKPHKLGTM